MPRSSTTCRPKRLLARRGSVAGRRVPRALDALDVHSIDGLDALRRRALLAGTAARSRHRGGVRLPARPAPGRRLRHRARAERLPYLAMAGWLESVAGDRADEVAEGIGEHYASALESRPALASEDLPARATLSAAAAEGMSAPPRRPCGWPPTTQLRGCFAA